MSARGTHGPFSSAARSRGAGPAGSSPGPGRLPGRAEPAALPEHKARRGRGRAHKGAALGRAAQAPGRAGPRRRRACTQWPGGRARAAAPRRPRRAPLPRAAAAAQHRPPGPRLGRAGALSRGRPATAPGPPAGGGGAPAGAEGGLGSPDGGSVRADCAAPLRPRRSVRGLSPPRAPRLPRSLARSLAPCAAGTRRLRPSYPTAASARARAPRARSRQRPPSRARAPRRPARGREQRPRCAPRCPERCRARPALSPARRYARLSPGPPHGRAGPSQPRAPRAAAALAAPPCPGGGSAPAPAARVGHRGIRRLRAWRHAGTVTSARDCVLKNERGLSQRDRERPARGHSDGFNGLRKTPPPVSVQRLRLIQEPPNSFPLQCLQLAHLPQPQ
ncbi:translation initiation factor IF-2-like [Oenanthe melanoleuca]|uniref:translation initiation factor IF-2-like n=1 Tax=Oenanthe melanoleuca TaxID=2939378 RepID=UPI0024C16341|nr:translation initiation factor IF-2-like [Oenanthe melanoleuca]